MDNDATHDHDPLFVSRLFDVVILSL